MIILDQNGNSFNWNPIKEASPRESCSELHAKAKSLLEEIYPTTIILEEVYVPHWKFRFDFLIPLFKLIVESNGQQHYQYSSFYHQSQLDFIQQKKRDAMKRYFCKLNNFNLIELPYWENEKEWKDKINEY